MQYEAGWIKRQINKAVAEIREWSPNKCEAMWVKVPEDSVYLLKEHVIKAAQRFVLEQGSFASEQNLRKVVQDYNDTQKD